MRLEYQYKFMMYAIINQKNHISNLNFSETLIYFLNWKSKRNRNYKWKIENFQNYFLAFRDWKWFQQRMDRLPLKFLELLSHSWSMLLDHTKAFRKVYAVSHYKHNSYGDDDDSVKYSKPIRRMWPIRSSSIINWEYKINDG